MKPIPTLYKGFQFRSRTEARWAVFFNTLGVRFEYEKEAYNLPPLPAEIDPEKAAVDRLMVWGGSEPTRNDIAEEIALSPIKPTNAFLKYLPDYYIPKQKRFPNGPMWFEIKGGACSYKDHMKLMRLIEATKTDGAFLGSMEYQDCWDCEQAVYFHTGGEDFPYLFCDCEQCGAIGFVFSGWTERIYCGCKHTGKGPRYDSDLINFAIEKARGYRFVGSFQS